MIRYGGGSKVWRANALGQAAAVALLALFISVACALASPSIAPKRQAFTTSDGVLLVGDVYAQGKKSPTVILWHMLGRNRSDFQLLIPGLLAQGFSVINMDQRGHGESVYLTNKSKIDYASFAAAQWAKLPSDALLVISNVERLPNLDGKRIGLVGASIGANMAAMASGDARVKACVLLSPGLDYHGMQPDAYITACTKPILMFAGRSDSDSKDALDRWGNKKPNLKAVTVPGKAHGNDLLKDTSIIKQTLAFLKTNLTQ